MPSNTKKPLYLGTCLDDLHKLGEVEIGKRDDPEKHLKVAEKAFMKADELWIEGDEEKSFVLFLRYLNSIENSKKTADYCKTPKKYSVFISKDKFITSINRGEVLKESLKKRYNERKESEEKLREIKEEPSPSETQVGAFISPGDAFSLLSTRPPAAVILDCRGAKERGKGFVTQLPYFPLPTDKPLLSISLAEIKLYLSTMDIPIKNVLLILLDVCAQEFTTPLDSPLLQFRDSLSKFDTDGQLREAPRVLDGGYESWALHYPAYSTGITQSENFTPTAKDDVIFPELDSPPLKPKDDFYKPRRTPPPTPSSPPTREFGNSDVSMDSNGNDVITPEISPTVSKNLDVISTIPDIPPRNNDVITIPDIPPRNNDVITMPNIPPRNNDVITMPNIPPNNDVITPQPTTNDVTDNIVLHPNIYIPTAMLAPRLPYMESYSDFITNSLPPIPKPSDHAILTADPTASLPPGRSRADPLAEEMGRELEEKERRLRALESQVAEKGLLEEKIRTLEQKVGIEQREVEMQKQKMLQEIANQKSQVDRELGEKQRQLVAMEEHAKLNLQLEKESINMDKARILQAKSMLDEEKKQVEKGKIELERDKLEFERVKRAVLEQQKLAQQAQAANPSHQFTDGQTGAPQMQLNHGLPPGWKKLFDSNTGRFYYQDDKTKTTHWNPPTSWIVSQQPNIMEGKTKGALLSSFQQPAPSKPDSEPIITPVPASGQVPTPKIDRTTKPTPVKTPEIPSRATKNPALSNPYYPQILARIQAKSKSRLLDPTHGGQGQALTGLKNLGNTCFMNSILQCLTATYPLAEYFITLRFIHHVNPVNPLGMGGEIAEEFAFLVQALWRGAYKSVAPRDFKTVLSKFAPQFSGSQQHDSQEFLAFLLDGLHEDLNKVLRKEYIQEQDNQGIPDPKAAQISWDNHLKRNDSIIVDLFQGQFKSTLTCLQCGFSSVTFEAFMYLSVPIPSSAHVTLIDCVRHFTKAERVSGSNSWFCARCKTHRDSAKQLQIWRLPPVLLIHLKRFSFVGKWKQKLDTNVAFPLSGLDLSAMTLGPLRPTPYQLFAVSNHSGTLDGGHYTAYVRNAVNSRFYTFDDSVVREMPSASVMSKNGYMLFYTSVDFTPKLKL